MARQGGDNRAFTSPHGRDLLYARLVLEAMCNDTTEAGKRFAKEREDLYLRWHRLIRTIIADHGGDSPFPSIESVDEILDYLEWHRKSHVYPKPRPLTPDEQNCLKWRTEIALEATQEIFINLGRPSQPQDWDGTEGPWSTWEEVSTYLGHWGNEPYHNANPNSKLKQSARRHGIIIEYRKEIASFCARWRLNAWWGAPSVIDDQFVRAQLEPNWDPSTPPLSLYRYDPGPRVAVILTAKLPSRTQEQYEQGRLRSMNRAEATDLHLESGPVHVIRTDFSREEWSEWEKTTDVSCVTVEWNGDRYIPQVESSDSPCTPGEFLVGRCEERLGRALKGKEKREIRSNIRSQMNQSRQTLRDAGWVAVGDRDWEFIARCIAGKLLCPKRPWKSFSTEKPAQGLNNNYHEIQSIRRGCQEFAAMANLILPPGRPGRIAGSFNIDR